MNDQTHQSDLAISLVGASKHYRLGQLASAGRILRNLKRRLRGEDLEHNEEFVALANIDIEIKKGEVVGIIGTNGAGKSTLLKLLARVAEPTTGKLEVNGSLAPLIEVGAGLVADLTGRENIVLNGAILGIPRKEIKSRIPEIAEFAELTGFLDTPIKRYSSGMKVRLGFSIATSVDPDILLVDEVLAVGDLAFQRKCFDRMEDLIRNRGKTVLLVSHNIRQVERLCSRVILLNHGRIVADGEPGLVCNEFYKASNTKIAAHQTKSVGTAMPALSSGEIDVHSVDIFTAGNDREIDEVPMHSGFRVRVHFQVHQALEQVEIVSGFHTTDFVYVASTSTAAHDQRRDFGVGMHIVEWSLDDLPLSPGVYSIRVVFLDRYRRKVWQGENLRPFRVSGGGANESRLPGLGLVDLPFRWCYPPDDAAEDDGRELQTAVAAQR